MAGLAIAAAIERLDSGRTDAREFVVEPNIVICGSALEEVPGTGLL